MFGIAAIVVMLCSFDMEYDELLANLRRAGMWLPAVVGLWIIIYLFNTLSWYIIIRDGKKGTPIPFWKVYKLTVSGFERSLYSFLLTFCTHVFFISFAF